MPLRVEFSARVPPLLTRMVAQSRSGISGNLGREIANIMRFGRGSVQDQFAKQALDDAFRGRRAWPPTKSVRGRIPSQQILVRTGRLRNAWLGSGPESITEIHPNSVAIGVSAAVPYAAPHQTGSTIRRLPQRAVGISPDVIDRVGKVILAHITGKSSSTA